MASIVHRSTGFSALTSLRRRRLVLSLLVAVTAMAEHLAKPILHLKRAGPAWPGQPLGAGDTSLVILLPDALSRDGASEPCIDRLLAREVATMVLGLGAGRKASPPLVGLTAHPDAFLPAFTWAREAGFPQISLLTSSLAAHVTVVGAAGPPAGAPDPGYAALGATLYAVETFANSPAAALLAGVGKSA